MLAPVGHTQLHHPGHFLAETNAAGAMDAAAHLAHADQWPYVFHRYDALFFLVAGGRFAIADRQILQLAFTALVANGAVQRVVNQQKLHHRLLRLDGLVRLGAHHHALGDRRGAGRHGFGRFFDIHQAHAAVGRDAQLLVVAKMGDISARLFGSMHHHTAFKHFYFFPVEFDFNHGVAPQT